MNPSSSGQSREDICSDKPSFSPKSIFQLRSHLSPSQSQSVSDWRTDHSPTRDLSITISALSAGFHCSGKCSFWSDCLQQAFDLVLKPRDSSCQKRKQENWNNFTAFSEKSLSRSKYFSIYTLMFKCTERTKVCSEAVVTASCPEHLPNPLSSLPALSCLQPHQINPASGFTDQARRQFLPYLCWI